MTTKRIIKFRTPKGVFVAEVTSERQFSGVLHYGVFVKTTTPMIGWVPHWACEMLRADTKQQFTNALDLAA